MAEKDIFDVESTVLFKNDGENLNQRVDFIITGDVSGRAEIALKGAGFSLSEDVLISGKHKRFHIFVPEIRKIQTCLAKLKSDGKEFSKNVHLVPQKKWEVHIIHFSHTDTGYTDLPSRIARNHGRFLKDVINFCERTNQHPNDSKFRWTIETGYQFENGWERLSLGERDEIISLIKEGRIELTPIYLSHNTELYDPEILWRTILFTSKFAQKHGIELKSAMNTDIPGQPWAIPQLLAKAGIRYFNTAVNETRGRAPYLPRPFYWEAQDGSRVLVWNHDPKNAYIEGATLGFVTEYEVVLNKLHRYLNRYSRDDFPYNIIGFRTAGQHADNAGPVFKISDVIKKWNEEWVYPRLIFSTNASFMESLEKRWGDHFPVFKGAWCDYWIDTFGTVARETANSRVAHPIFNTAEKIASITKIYDKAFQYPHEEFTDTLKYLMLADEVDWCAYEATALPDSLQAKGQFYEQASFAYRGAITAEETMSIAEYGFLPLIKSKSGSLIVFNPLSWERNDIVNINIPNRYLKGRIPIIRDGAGNEFPCHKVGEAPMHQTFCFFAEGIPSLGYKKFNVEIADKEQIGSHFLSDKLNHNALENKFYRIKMAEDGTIESIYDKESKHELVNPNDNVGFFQPIYEETVGGGPPVLLDNMADEDRRWSIDLDFMDFAHTVFPNRFPDKDTKFNRIQPKGIESKSFKQNSLFSSISTRSSLINIFRLERTVVLYDNLKRIEFRVNLDKREVRDAEAVYIGFPFAMEDFQFEMENAYSFLKPEIEQLPRSCRDWYLVQKWIRLFDGKQQIIWSPLEAPLVQLSEIQTGKWLHSLDLSKSTIYSWLFNNYWWTNTPASQGGWNYNFRYAVGSENGDTSRLKAVRFGSEFQTPLRGWFFEKDHSSGKLPTDRFSLCEVKNSNVVITAMKSAEDSEGIIIRLFEVEGRSTNTVIYWNGPVIKNVYLTDPVEQNLKEIESSKNSIRVEMNPFSVTTMRVLYD